MRAGGSHLTYSWGVEVAGVPIGDVSAGFILLVGGGYLVFYLARAWQLSVVPTLVLLPSFTTIGAALYLQSSPLYLPSDGEFYKRWGYSLAESWSTGSEPIAESLWPGKGFWPLIIGGLTALFGPVTFTLIVFNGLVLVATVVVLQRTVFVLSGNKTRGLIILIFLSSPPFVLFGASLLREAIFWLALALGLLALAWVVRRQYVRCATYAVPSFALLIAIRPDAGLVLGYGITAMALLTHATNARKKNLRPTLLSVGTVICLAFSFPLAFDVVRPGTSAVTVETSTSELSAPNVASAFGGDLGAELSEGEGGGPFGISCESALGLAVICSALEHMPNAFFGPFYWEYGPEPIWLISGISTLHFLLLLTLSVFLFVSEMKLRIPAAVFLVLALGSMIMFSAILTNYGILIRFRAATEIILIPTAILGFHSARGRLGSFLRKRASGR